MRLKLVIQGNSTGCGIACVAMIANIKSYAEVKNMMESVGCIEKNRFRTDYDDIKKALSTYNIKYNDKICRKKLKSNQRNVAIVKINHKEKSGNWHWVVYDPTEKCFLDPNHKLKKNHHHRSITDKRITISSYICDYRR